MQQSVESLQAVYDAAYKLGILPRPQSAKETVKQGVVSARIEGIVGGECVLVEVVLREKVYSGPPQVARALERDQDLIGWKAKGAPR